jgi:hypothetical protein
MEVARDIRRWKTEEEGQFKKRHTTSNSKLFKEELAE